MTSNDSSPGGGRKYYPQKPEKPRASMLNRFVDRIRTTFQKFQGKPAEHHLIGRIQDLQNTANSVLNQLSTIKDELRNEIDPEIFSYVEMVLEPIIKEVSRLHKSMEQSSGSVTHQAKTYQRYSQWIDKAKLWVQICSKANNKEALVKAIIRYTVDEFLELIDRDIQVINDYQEHMLDALAVDDEEKIALAQRLETYLDPYLKGLNQLKFKPRDLTLQEIALWKAQVDKRREKYFDAALHSIDKVINSTIPDTSGPEEHEHLVEILSQIIYLEHEAPNLYDEIFMAADINSEQRKIFESRIMMLEQEIHQLNLDLRLTPDLIDRLQIISDMLDQARNKL